MKGNDNMKEKLWRTPEFDKGVNKTLEKMVITIFDMLKENDFTAAEAHDFLTECADIAYRMRISTFDSGTDKPSENLIQGLFLKTFDYSE